MDDVEQGDGERWRKKEHTHKDTHRKRLRLKSFHYHVTPYPPPQKKLVKMAKPFHLHKLVLLCLPFYQL